MSGADKSHDFMKKSELHPHPHPHSRPRAHPHQVSGADTSQGFMKKSELDAGKRKSKPQIQRDAGSGPSQRELAMAALKGNLDE